MLPAALVLVLSGSFIGALGSAGRCKVSFFTQILLIVLILGAGTDYGLFLVFRVREQLLAGSEPQEAVAYAVRRVGESITASAATVVVALLTLLAASFGLYHDLGVPLAIGIATMLVAGLTLLPALLAIFGRAVFWPTKTACPATGRRRLGPGGRPAGPPPGPDPRRRGGRPRRRGRVRPRLQPTGFGGDVTAPAGSDAAKGNAALAAHFPQSSANPTNVVMHFPTSVWEHPRQLETATDGPAGAAGEFRTITGPLNPNGAALSPRQLSPCTSRSIPTARPSDLVTRPLVPPAGSAIPLAEYVTYLTTARYISADGHTVQWETGLARRSRPGATPPSTPCRPSAARWPVPPGRPAPTPAGWPGRLPRSTT